MFKPNAEANVQHISNFTGCNKLTFAVLALCTIAASVTSCKKDAEQQKTVVRPTTEVFMDYYYAMYGTGSTTKSTAGNTALLDSLAYKTCGQIHTFKYDYSNPDTVMAKSYIIDHGYTIDDGVYKTWQLKDGTLVTQASGGNNFKYAKDTDGKIIEKLNLIESKYFPQDANTVLKKDLNNGVENIITILKRVVK